ncbi:hypothetical protein AB0H36_11715 [Kribbella sp. NPDC050820]|uniref:hypothetical protein n=1 Tax=Kribbella sp. NPDC050820 TaxID=3155408 RepID=UPI0034064C0E
MPEGSKRLLAFIALHEGRVDRRLVAGTLWPLGDDDRAAGNLRSSLWRLKGAGIDVLRADKCALWLDPTTSVDISTIDNWAQRVIEGHASAEELRLPRWGGDALDLLPGWYDDWVIFDLCHIADALAVEPVVRDTCGEFALQERDHASDVIVVDVGDETAT